MKSLLLLFVVISFLFSKSEVPSTIPPAQSVFINLETQECHTECLNELLNNGKIFSFLSVYQNHSEYDDIQNAYNEYSKLFGMSRSQEVTIKVAMLVPQKTIRRYAISTVNSVFTYLLYRKFNFDLKVYNCEDESEKSILDNLQKIKDDGFIYVIAPFTEVGANILTNHADGLIAYIPTVNVSKIQNPRANVILGGIDYKAQIEKLLDYTADKIAIFSDNSSIANELDSDVATTPKNIIYSKQFHNNRLQFKKVLKWNKALDGASIFLNLPLVKASLLASQLRVYDRKPYNLLSTQINYNPMILTLTQYADRKSMLIANSIGETKTEIVRANEMLGGDIEYDWVNYSTTLGIDMLYETYFLADGQRDFSETIANGQVQYGIKIMSPKIYTIRPVE
ncbi:hypothetical protein [Sulfurospirillum sp. 1612]|uniref:hypothetical protein n=1 Tax=Sulfurospirillum sp. 1612 TaxID=3094835 RepID=UPI002F94DDD0